ncbi:MAP kinase kinase PBS2 [Penicillium macrosclerotiorum]|uniref:MAP kinase kinase PBS2 n=1 Tax=Penicillium macrosclerotiorum TaxID=303699 RepID=UPI002547A996|nr:MAP kinase kinase PBS2 [Penicillium macrosclerotiorum]KAJ5682728.1 MAP kinase kinase PBS2 [Penicillium macrosclerotiorum]
MDADRDPAVESQHPLAEDDRSPQGLEITSTAIPAPHASTPSLRPTRDPAAGITASSTHLGQINAARRAAGTPPRLQASMSAQSSGGLNQDIMAKMKAFSLSRQGAPLAHTASTGTIPTSHEVGAGGALAGRIPTVPRPNNKNWASSPAIPASISSPASPRPGGLAAKRMKPGLKLSDVTGGPPPAANGTEQKPPEQNGESAFSKYSEFIDTKAGTLNFKNKAILHGGGVEFSSGHSFKISLDEVDRLDELGKGNYGTVYKVRHSRPHLRKPGLGLSGIISHAPGHDESIPEAGHQDNLSGVIMAMKEIRLELDEAKFAQIIMELDILHRCVSPFIIDFYGAFFQEGAVYMCVEYMDGGSIDKLYQGGVPEDILRKVTLSTVMGLKALKDEHNIIHRDVKPTNILVNSKGQIKICDFGVSGNLVASIAKTNIGCQSYMAPERIAGGGMQQSGASSGGTYSVQSDIWSLGLSIIECAMGRYPYPPETFTNIFSQLHAIVHGDPPALPAEGFSEEAHAFVSACLDKNPKNRPTYNMLLRHAWLAPLMQPPTEAESATDSCESSTSGSNSPSAMTEDKEVSEWVHKQLQRRKDGLLRDVEKPALHAVALDKVATSPIHDESFSPSQMD